MVTIVTAADFHFCDNPPSSRIDDYCESLFNKLDQILTLCIKTKASFLLIPGDLFHIKTASKTSHRLVQRLIKKFKLFSEAGCKTVLIAGNHDLSFSNLESIEKQPLGVLFSSGYVQGLTQNQTDWAVQEIKFKEDDLKIRIVGSSFGENPENSLQSLAFNKEDEDYLICMAHVFAGPLRVNFFGSMILGYRDMLDLGPDIFVFGHLHKDQGIQTINNKHFVNVGAIARGSIAEDDINRKPKVAILQIKKGEVKTISICLKVLPSDQIFDLKLKTHEDQRSKEIQTFIEMLSKESEPESENIKAHLTNSSFDSIVKERALTYLERAEE